MSFIPKIFKTNGGDELVIAKGGKLTINPGAKVVGLPDAGTSTKGLVKQAAAVSAAAGSAPTKAEFDALLTALKNAGIMANS